MSTDIPAPEFDAWTAVSVELSTLDPLLAAKPVNALAVAKQFQALAAAMRVAMESHGTASSRFRAVTKALDLKTPKSKLAAFLAND